MKEPSLITQMRELVNEYDDLKTMVAQAKSHLRAHIADFDCKELECLAMDRLIDYKDIPESKRTDFVRSRVR